MALHVGTVVLDVADMQRASAFWSRALGYEVVDEEETWTKLQDPAGRGVALGLQPNPEPKGDANRVHLDLPARDMDAEVARLVGLGAERIPWDYPEGADFIVLADTEGNEFCIVPDRSQA